MWYRHRAKALCENLIIPKCDMIRKMAEKGEPQIQTQLTELQRENAELQAENAQLRKELGNSRLLFSRKKRFGGSPRNFMPQKEEKLHPGCTVVGYLVVNYL